MSVSQTDAPQSTPPEFVAFNLALVRALGSYDAAAVFMYLDFPGSEHPGWVTIPVEYLARAVCLPVTLVTYIIADLLTRGVIETRHEDEHRIAPGWHALANAMGTSYRSVR